ncbi:MAG: type II toxin-antitoxin system VapB family antitoxin [Chloroflexota bacterium]
MEVQKMRATLNIPDDLLSEVQQLTNERSKTRAIVVAMQEFVRQQKIKDLIALRGKISIDYDWQEEEEREMEAQGVREGLIGRKTR